MQECWVEALDFKQRCTCLAVEFRLQSFRRGLDLKPERPHALTRTYGGFAFRSHSKCGVSGHK